METCFRSGLWEYLYLDQVKVLLSSVLKASSVSTWKTGTRTTCSKGGRKPNKRISSFRTCSNRRRKRDRLEQDRQPTSMLPSARSVVCSRTHAVKCSSEKVCTILYDRRNTDRPNDYSGIERNPSEQRSGVVCPRP
jgi:hypothetical protein